jgi:glycosyltransferase involved in cell wall biosynthesis
MAVVPLSVVVPAYNDATALGGCLDALVAQRAVSLTIVVVANGCQDDTANVARRHAGLAAARGHRLVVVDLPAPGKARALNAGDDNCPPGSRLYLDADARLSPTAAHDIATALRPGSGIHLAAPRLRVHPPVNRVAASYATVWSQLPYVREQVLGCGAYAVSETGRSRWASFPEVLSDDRFVRLHFRPDEQRVLPSCTFSVTLPERAGELFATRARWCRGNRQLTRLFPELAAHDTPRVLPAARFLATRVSLWPHVPVFAALFGYGRVQALRKVDSGSSWERETSSAARANRRAVA